MTISIFIAYLAIATANPVNATTPTPATIAQVGTQVLPMMTPLHWVHTPFWQTVP